MNFSDKLNIYELGNRKEKHIEKLFVLIDFDHINYNESLSTFRTKQQKKKQPMHHKTNNIGFIVQSF